FHFRQTETAARGGSDGYGFHGRPPEFTLFHTPPGGSHPARGGVKQVRSDLRHASKAAYALCQIARERVRSGATGSDRPCAGRCFSGGLRTPRRLWRSPTP